MCKALGSAISHQQLAMELSSSSGGFPTDKKPEKSRHLMSKAF
jgi:hypothetical protein